MPAFYFESDFGGIDMHLQTDHSRLSRIAGRAVFWLALSLLLLTAETRARAADPGLQSLVSETDSLSLVALYESTGGNNWTDNTGWLVGPVESWHGITVSSGRVTRIEMVANGLEGSLPVEIGDLEMLEELILAGNHLEGDIPVEIGRLAELRVLVLADNFFTGVIPVEIGDLRNLQQLLLHSNILGGSIPKEIGRLESLTHLFLANTGLSGQIPDSLGRLSSLEYLDLGLNELSGPLPEALADLASLVHLSVSANPLSGPIPFRFIELTNLATFNFDRTSLCEPEHVDFQAWLSGRSVSSTGLVCAQTVSVPDSLALLAFFKTLNGTNWTGADNWLVGPVDNWVGVQVEDRRVVGLVLDGVMTEGNLPDALWDLDGLRYLIMGGNGLSGTIPEGIGQLTNLVALSLQENDLTGPIPASIGNLATLDYLNLARNHLGGPLPPELGQLSALQILDLSNNDISGELPEQLANLVSLLEFSIAFNPLEGPIPEAFVNLSNLATFGYNHTELCEPNEPEFQAWLDRLGGGRTGTLCSDSGSPLGDEADGSVPDIFVVSDIYPNPTASWAILDYDLPRPVNVEIAVFSIEGSRVRTVLSGLRPAGRHRLEIEMSDLPSGAYILRMAAENYIWSRAILVVK